MLCAIILWLFCCEAGFPIFRSVCVCEGVGLSVVRSGDGGVEILAPQCRSTPHRAAKRLHPTKTPRFIPA